MSVHVIQPALHQLQSPADLPPGLAILQATPPLAGLVRSTNLQDRLARTQGQSPTHTQRDDNSNQISLQLFRWLAGAWTPIHDHTRWDISVYVAGSPLEDRYVRSDDGVQPGRARLRHHWRSAWQPGQQSHLLPYSGGIHCGGNPENR